MWEWTNEREVLRLLPNIPALWERLVLHDWRSSVAEAKELGSNYLDQTH